MRTTITIDRNNVTVERDNPFSGERDSTTYFVPTCGGYVRIRTVDGRNPQVCDGLAQRGNTLRCDSPEKLPTLIRRELRILQRNERNA